MIGRSDIRFGEVKLSSSRVIMESYIVMDLT